MKLFTTIVVLKKSYKKINGFIKNGKIILSQNEPTQIILTKEFCLEAIKTIEVFFNEILVN
jgi:hypothetical protein